jgi:hypothetical protein
MDRDERHSTAGLPGADASPVEVEPGAVEPANDLPPIPVIRWLQASMADLGNRDFEAPIAGLTSVASYELSERYRRAVRPLGAAGPPPDTPEARLFMLLSAVTGMHLKAHERDEPFGAMVTFADGSRSAIPADFRDGPVELLSAMASRAANPVLRARLADMCWLLDRRRGRLGSLAIAAYVDMIEAVESGALKFPFAKDHGALEHNACDLLRRALQIGRTIGWDKSASIRAREAVTRLRERAVQMRAGIEAVWFGELDLDFGVSDPVAVATGAEQVLAAPTTADVHILTSLWRLAARAYHVAKRDDDKYRCQAAAAGAMVAEAERILAGQGKAAAMLASHMMSNAIAQLHGIPAKRELRHRLIDIQARIPEEMSVFSHQWDATDMAAKVRGAIGDGVLLDQLFIFAAITTSPDPATLRTEAQESMRQHPLGSLFSTVHYDREGKAVHRSAGATTTGDPADSAIGREIAQAESIRRNMFGTAIEIGRRSITAQHFLSEDLLASLLQHSPFVPPDQVGTFSRGFLRFFQGDFTSAIYILTPLLENALWHVLKMNGHDITIFDDATQTQQDRTISTLFEQMRAELDAAFTKPITTDIESVFLNRPGPHLRHDIAHGLGHDGTPYGADAAYGCWLIFRLCLLPLFPYRDQLRGLIH